MTKLSSQHQEMNNPIKQDYSQIKINTTHSLIIHPHNMIAGKTTRIENGTDLLNREVTVPLPVKKIKTIPIVLFAMPPTPTTPHKMRHSEVPCYPDHQALAADKLSAINEIAQIADSGSFQTHSRIKRV